MEASLKFHHLLSFSLILASSILCESASEYGFTMELVHRESPRSPYYDPAETPYQRVASALRRSIARVHRLNPNSAGDPDTPSAVIVSNGGEYLMNISLGKPPVTIVGIADTGSDLIWTQCKPCTDCFKQATPLFDPSDSSTYKDVSCRASLCGAISQTSCGEGAGLCEYSYSYGDNSYTMGTLATETFTIGSTSGRPVSFPTVLFGCGHDNGGNFGDGQMSGIIGLGGGGASLISQMGKATGGKFSYCLVPFFSDDGKSSKLNFGANAVVAGTGVVSTPLIQKEQKTFYYLTLEAVSVGNTRIEFTSEDPSSSDDGGNIIIDSGTTLTLLPQDFYTQIEAAMVKSVKLPRASDPSQLLSLCYEADTDVGLRIPTVTFHFNGADVGLGAGNSFVRVADDIICFTLNPGEMAIYGNLAQMNYLVGYDTQNMKLSFKPVDCTSN
ncbi:uncharacterized protein J3R85_013578 [Psidium guajava]|nr:uncharacterized protein J3R85_013578 [Psidium guajava]